jgi:hypothetical protein
MQSHLFDKTSKIAITRPNAWIAVWRKLAMVGALNT